MRLCRQGYCEHRDGENEDAQENEEENKASTHSREAHPSIYYEVVLYECLALQGHNHCQDADESSHNIKVLLYVFDVLVA